MRRIITGLLIAISIEGYSQAQTGGEISGRTESGTRKSASMDSIAANRFALMIHDSILGAKVPTGLTVNSNRLAIYSPDSIRVFATNGFGSGSGSTSLDATDSTNLATAASTNYQWNTTASGRNYQFISGMAETTPFTRTDGNMSPLSLTQRGYLRVEVAGGGVVSTFTPNRSASIGSTVEPSIDTFGRMRVVDTAANGYLSAINTKIPSNLTVTSTRLLVDGSGVTQPVSGTFWQATQPVSGTVTATVDSTTASRKGVVLLANPTIANTSFAVTNAGTFAVQSTNQANSGVDIGDVTINNAAGASAVNIQDGGNSITVDGTVAATQSGTWNITNVSGTVSLPTGAATAAKQPALGTSGTASSDVITIQGISGMTAVKTDAAQSGTWNITNVSGTVSLPTGASTEATLSTLNGKIPSNLTVTSTRLLVDGSGVTQPTSFTRLKASTDTVAISGSISATAGATAIYDSARTVVALDTAGLAAKANSATVGWQSDTVGLRQHKVTDMKLGVKISFANTAPGNDKALYIYACPWWYDGTTWYAGSQGTTTLPTGANGTTTIASPNDLRLIGVLSYTTQNQVCQSQFNLSNVFGETLPDAVSFIIINYTGAAIHTSGNLLYYSLTQRTQR